MAGEAGLASGHDRRSKHGSYQASGRVSCIPGKRDASATCSKEELGRELQLAPPATLEN